MRRKWNRELALLALQREAQRIGRTPGQHALRKPDCVAAPETVYRRLFGSTRAAQIAAGLVPNTKGKPTGWRKVTCKRGHRRTPSNLDAQGHCRLCAAFWTARLGRGVMLPRRKRPAPALPARVARQITMAKRAYWGMSTDVPSRASYPRPTGQEAA